MVEIKGALVNGTINNIKIRSGDQVYNNIISQLDEQSRQLFEKLISDAGWYPLNSYMRFLELDLQLTADRDGQVLSDNSHRFLSGSPLKFIPHPSFSVYPSKPRQASCRQDPDEAAVHCSGQRTS